MRSKAYLTSSEVTARESGGENMTLGLIFTVTVLASGLIWAGAAATSGVSLLLGSNEDSGRGTGYMTRKSSWKYAWPGSRCSQPSADTTLSVPPFCWPCDALTLAAPPSPDADV